MLPPAAVFAAMLAAGSVRAAGIDDDLAAARDVCRRRPDSVRALDRLAALTLKKYRQTHAAETLAAASAVIDRGLALDPSDFDARRFRTAVALTNHEFADVIRRGESLASERPRDTDVLGMIADAQMETGAYAGALATIQRMVDLRPGLPAYSRVSYAREIHGDVSGAIAAMDQAIAAGDPADPEGVAWCVARSGLLCWKLGRLDDASRRFDAARRLFPRSPYAWEGAGFVAAARGDLDAAAAAFEHAFEIVPWPQYAAERVDVARALGRDDDAKRWAAIVGAIERISTEAGLFNRALALFEADHGDPDRAVAMAEGELASRKDVYGWDAAAWALYRAGRIVEAAEAARHATALGTEDPLLDAHAGMIFAAAGDADAARRHLSRALSANAAFHPLLARQARERLAALESGPRVVASR